MVLALFEMIPYFCIAFRHFKLDIHFKNPQQQSKQSLKHTKTKSKHTNTKYKSLKIQKHNFTKIIEKMH